MGQMINKLKVMIADHEEALKVLRRRLENNVNPQDDITIGLEIDKRVEDLKTLNDLLKRLETK